MFASADITSDAVNDGVEKTVHEVLAEKGTFGFPGAGPTLIGTQPSLLSLLNKPQGCLSLFEQYVQDRIKKPRK